VKSYSDIVGDGGSRIVEQVEAGQRKIAESLAGVRRRVAIGSGKGGVGKSTLTRLLASTLAADGSRVAILDADLNGPSQACLAGLGAAPLVPGDDGLCLPLGADGVGVVSLGSILPESEAVAFDSVSDGGSHVWRATREFAFLGQLIGAVDWGKLDWLLYDLPPGAERTFQYAEFLGADTAFVLVTLPTELSRGVVARSVTALRQAPNRLVGYIENMTGYVCPGCDDVQPLFPASDAENPLDVTLLGRLPFDPRLAAAGSPAADGPAAEALCQIVKRLRRAVEDDS